MCDDFYTQMRHVLYTPMRHDFYTQMCHVLYTQMLSRPRWMRGGGLGSRPIFKKFHETYAPS